MPTSGPESSTSSWATATSKVPICLVLISGFFHALWNVAAKKSRNKTAFLFSIQCLSLTAFFPFIWTELSHFSWQWQAAGLFALSSLIHGLYFLVLSRAYSIGQISQVYPIARGTACLAAPFFGVFLLNEHLTPIGWLGIIFIVTGILTLGNFRLKQAIHGHVQLAMMMGLTISAYILVDKLALNYGSPLFINWIGTIGNIIIMTFFLKRRSTLLREWTVNWKLILIGAVLAPLSYILFLWAAQLGQMAQLSPIREIGTVFGVGIGVIFLKESQGKQRFWASCAVMLGILLLGYNR